MKFLRMPSPAMIVAMVALFTALGGATYAATNPFVGSSGQITGCVGKKNALSVVHAGDVCPAGKETVTWSQTGPAGPQGPAGKQGPQGKAGSSKSLEVKDVKTEIPTSVAGLAEVRATCPEGFALIGGGAGANTEAQLIDSGPGPETGVPKWWGVIYHMPENGEFLIKAVATCARLR